MKHCTYQVVVNNSGIRMRRHWHKNVTPASWRRFREVMRTYAIYHQLTATGEIYQIGMRF